MLRTLFVLLFIYTAVAPARSQPAKVLFEQKNFTAAKSRFLQLLASNPSDAEALYFLGRIAVEEKAYETSIERFEEAIKANPKVAEYHNWLGVMYGVVAKDVNVIRQGYLATKIKNEFLTAASLEPANLQTQWGLIHFYTQAPGCLGGSWEKAFACASVITRHDAAQGQRALGFIHSAQNKNDKAEKELNMAVALDPVAENVFALGLFYEQQNQVRKAQTVYENFLLKNPDNKLGGFYLGRIYSQSGNPPDRGIVLLNQYLSYKPQPNEPSQSLAYLGLGAIYEKKGDKTKAKSYYQTSLTLQPGMKEAADGLGRVK